MLTKPVAGTAMIFTSVKQSDDFMIGNDRKTEHFKVLAKNDGTSAIADQRTQYEWDHFDS